jgi:Flp pilus assembly protein TadG
MKLTRNGRREREGQTGLPETANSDCASARSKRPRKRRGQSLVELSLILPLLMFICLGTIDLGRMFYGYIQMTNAVREGASVASHQPTNTSEITSAISTHSSNLPTGYTWSCPACSGSTKAGDSVTITATWSFQPITFTFLSQFGLGGPISMSTHSTMKVL